VDAPLVVVRGESIQLPMQVEAVPEERLVEILRYSRRRVPMSRSMNGWARCIMNDSISSNAAR
jgi:hypothetical protein